jgi:hypothetical protein
MNRITYEELQDKLDYNPHTGLFTYKNVRGKYPGDLAGTIRSSGYIGIKLNGKEYPAHHLAWFWCFGLWPKEVDHIDHNKLNNAIKNLRAVTHAENSLNRPHQVNNQSGVQGIFWQQSRKRWLSRIKFDGRLVWQKIYRFEDFNKAVEERQAKLKELGFHQNHGKSRKE